MIKLWNAKTTRHDLGLRIRAQNTMYIFGTCETLHCSHIRIFLNVLQMLREVLLHFSTHSATYTCYFVSHTIYWKRGITTATEVVHQRENVYRTAHVLDRDKNTLNCAQWHIKRQVKHVRSKSILVLEVNMCTPLNEHKYISMLVHSNTRSTFLHGTSQTFHLHCYR